MTDEAPLPARSLDLRAVARIQHRLQAAQAAPWLHAESARRMAERLAIFRHAPQRIADLSGTSGGAASILTKACPGAKIWRAGAPSGRSWWQRMGLGRTGPPRQDPVDDPVDLVWSVMQLHWAQDPPSLLQAWRRRLAPEGALMFSTLGPGTLDRLRRWYVDAGWGSPMAPLVDMHDLGDMMVRAGYEGPVMDQETLVLTWADPLAALRELRSLGANADPARAQGLRTPRWRERLLDALRAGADPQGRIQLDFELVYGHAVRGPDRGPALTADTRIGLDEMSAMLRRRPPK